MRNTVIQVIGYKNSGKTTITCELIRRFSNMGWNVGSIKHDAHTFEVDYPGKDTWLHREAGAKVVAITSRDKTAIMEQRPVQLDQMIERITGVDVIVVEGYKSGHYPKLVLLRDEGDIPLLEEAVNVIAAVSRFPYQHMTIPVLSIDNMEQIFESVLSYIQP